MNWSGLIEPMDAAPSAEVPRAFLIGIFAVGIFLAVLISVLGIYGYIGSGIP